MRLKIRNFAKKKKKPPQLQPQLLPQLPLIRSTIHSSNEGKTIKSVPKADVAVQHDIWLPRTLPGLGFVYPPVRESRLLVDWEIHTVDAEIIKDATKCKMDLAGGLQRTLHGDVKPSTHCITTYNRRT